MVGTVNTEAGKRLAAMNAGDAVSDAEEPCEECGRPNYPIAWHVPDDLWLNIVGRADGFLCIPCFTAKAHRAGVEVDWLGERFDLKDESTWRIAAKMNAEDEERLRAALEGIVKTVTAQRDWRHARWCDWERSVDDCSCGLDDFRAALDAALAPEAPR